MTTELKLLLQKTLAKLTQPGFSLARSGYATNILNKPCGLHCHTAQNYDLAGLLWLAGESIQEETREYLFNQAWQALRAHLSWDARQNPSHNTLCLFLDRHSIEWHVMVVEQLLNEQEYKQPPRSVASGVSKETNNSLLNEYV